MKELYARCRGAKVIQVIAVEANEGDGTEGDPIQRVLYLYDFDGNLLAKSGDDKKRLYNEKHFMILRNK